MDNILSRLVFATIFPFLVTCYLIPLFRKFAVKIGAVDVPDGKIKLHKKVTPYLGGLAVYCGFISALTLVCPFDDRIIFFLVGTTFLLFLGLVDDLVVMKPQHKLFGQCVATLCFLKGGFYLKENFFSSFWNIAASSFWVLLIINAFNLVDVMDGLSSLLGVSCAIPFFILACIFQQWTIALLLASFIGALFAFFIYNRPPAKIYLGDSGSLFVGGFLAAIPFFFNWGCRQSFGYFSPIIILAVPLLELVTLIVIRLYKGIPFYNGSPDHFAIYLQQKKWSKNKVLWYILGLSLASGFVALLFVLDIISVPVVAQLGLAFLFIWFFILFIQ